MSRSGRSAAAPVASIASSSRRSPAVSASARLGDSNSSQHHAESGSVRLAGAGEDSNQENHVGVFTCRSRSSYISAWEKLGDLSERSSSVESRRVVENIKSGYVSPGTS